MQNQRQQKNLISRLQTFPITSPTRVMEVCGTHTVAIHRQGIHHLLPPGVRLVSGPGCPVCVTPGNYIDEALFLARNGSIITTFGDLIRVPGHDGSLQTARSQGCDIRIVYSPLEAIQIAEKTEHDTVFLAVGFETTIPAIAATIMKAREKQIRRFSILTALRLVPPALLALLSGSSRIDGFLLPGHVSTIIGLEGYSILNRFQIPGVMSGFTPGDIISSLVLLLEIITKKRHDIVNNYRRAVRDQGNPLSRRLYKTVFQPEDACWRGIGVLPNSGLRLREEYRDFDARSRHSLPTSSTEDHPGCRCGEVLSGMIDPPQCELHGTICTPETPVGPCMVSTEGSCQAWYRFG